MDVVLPRVSRLSRVFLPLGGKNFSTGLFANQSYDVKGKKEKDTALAYVSEDTFIFPINPNKSIYFRFPTKTCYRRILSPRS